MAKKVKAPKGLELKTETPTRLRINQLNREWGNTRGNPTDGVNRSVNSAKVKRAFKAVGKNSKNDKSLL